MSSPCPPPRPTRHAARDAEPRGRSPKLGAAAALLVLATTLAVPTQAQSGPEPTAGKPLAGGTSAPALDSELLRQAQSIARQTMSPFCPGRTLSDCPSEHAAAWRKEIQTMLAQGATAREIQEEFERRAGGDLSGRPHRGVGYGISFGLAAAALALLFGVLRLVRARKQPGEAHGKDAAGTDHSLSTGSGRSEGETSGGHPTQGPAEAGPAESAALDERLERELQAELGDDDDPP